MKTIIGVGFAAFFVSSLAIGLRLVWLARRNRGLPELLIGLGILGIGPAGFACSIFALLAGEGRPALASALLVGAQLAISVGALSAYVFNWTVFRRSEAWARLVVGGAAVLFAGVFLGRLATDGFTLPIRLGPLFHLSSIGTTGCLLWGSFESLRYYALMRRRARIGLADPLLTNRFLLWGLGIGSAGVGSLISVGVMIVTGQALRELDWLTLSNSLFGLASAVLMWVAFLPPAAYRRWIEQTAPSPAR